MFVIARIFQVLFSKIENHPGNLLAVEGMNKIIKTMKRHAYGFRDNEFFKLKIMAIYLRK
jgi:transposase